MEERTGPDTGGVGRSEPGGRTVRSLLGGGDENPEACGGAPTNSVGISASGLGSGTWFEMLLDEVDGQGGRRGPIYMPRGSTAEGQGEGAESGSDLGAAESCSDSGGEESPSWVCAGEEESLGHGGEKGQGPARLRRGGSLVERGAGGLVCAGTAGGWG